MLTNLDAHHQLKVRLGAARYVAVEMVERVADGETVHLLMRQDVFTVRKATQAQDVYWTRFLSIAFALAQNMERKESVMARFLQYREVVPASGMTKAQVSRIVDDFAVTIVVHPLALGVIR